MLSAENELYAWSHQMLKCTLTCASLPSTVQPLLPAPSMRRVSCKIDENQNGNATSEAEKWPYIPPLVHLGFQGHWSHVWSFKRIISPLLLISRFSAFISSLISARVRTMVGSTRASLISEQWYIPERAEGHPSLHLACKLFEQTLSCHIAHKPL